MGKIISRSATPAGLLNPIPGTTPHPSDLVLGILERPQERFASKGGGSGWSCTKRAIQGQPGLSGGHPRCGSPPAETASKTWASNFLNVETIDRPIGPPVQGSPAR